MFHALDQMGNVGLGDDGPRSAGSTPAETGMTARLNGAGPTTVHNADPDPRAEIEQMEPFLPQDAAGSVDRLEVLPKAGENSGISKRFVVIVSAKTQSPSGAGCSAQMIF